VSAAGRRSTQLQQPHEDNISRAELRARFILVRLLKVDIVISYDVGRYEENPDHYVPAASVEALLDGGRRGRTIPSTSPPPQPHAVGEVLLRALDQM
jgi:hypothetical protein